MTSQAPPRAGRREWLGLLMLTLPTMLVMMDMTVLHLAVPSLSADLVPTGSELLWIVDIYGFVIAGFLVPMGTLGDRIGRRRLLLIGAAAFAAASVLAAFSTSAMMLIVARALLGLAGSTLMPSTMALIRNMFLDEGQRMRAIGLWMTSFMVGGSIGPVVGGAMLESFWWGSLFLLGVPVMVVVLIGGPLLLPEYRDPQAQRMDVLSVGLSLLAILGVIYGGTHIATEGIGLLPVLVALAGVAVGYLFVRRQRMLANPLLDLALFTRPKFNVALAAQTFTTFCMMGFNLFVAQYLQIVVGLDPLAAGLWTLPATIAGMLVLGGLPVVAGGVRPAYVMSAGFVVAAVGFAMFTQVPVDGGLPLLVGSSIVMFVGLSAVGVVGANVVMSSAPVERAGSAAAVQETGTELGGALGLAALGSVGVAVYGSQMAEQTPAGVPDGVAAEAAGTVGGALTAAGELPAELGQQLVTVARGAFTLGLNVVALVCVVIVVVLAGLIVALLRDVVEPAEPAEPTEPTEPDTAGPEEPAVAATVGSAEAGPARGRAGDPA